MTLQDYLDKNKGLKRDIYLLFFDHNGEVQSDLYNKNKHKNFLNCEVMEDIEEKDYVEVWIK